MKFLRSSIFILILLSVGYALRAQVPGIHYYMVGGSCCADDRPPLHELTTTRIGVVADLHYLSPMLVDEGEALDSFERATGRVVQDLQEVLDKVFDNLKEEKIDVLLVPGDLTNHGERQSHIDLKQKLMDFIPEGVRVFVVPGNHDINVPNARAYTGANPTPTERITPGEFAEIYAPFGYSGALERDEASLSYLAELNDHTWLLCLDTNRYGEHTTTTITGGRIREETMDWALNILEIAKEKKVVVLGMMHHGLVEHMPYQSTFFPQYLVEGWEERADKLAGAGLKVVFTGHFHSNDVTRHLSPSNNAIYDVETASLAQYPFAYRIMELDEEQLSIETRFVASTPANPNLEEEYKEKLKRAARRVGRDRIKNLGIPIPEEALGPLVEVISNLSVMHARGDEELDEVMKGAIVAFADMLGGEADFDSFSFDFPPEDNRLVIKLDGVR